jgi:hypothetical protein
MSGDRELLYYRLTPIFKQAPGGFATAAIQECMATGKVLSGSGGGGLALSKDIVRALDRTRNNGKSRAIVDADDLDKLIGLAEDFRGIYAEMNNGGSVSSQELNDAYAKINTVLDGIKRDETNDQSPA